MKTLFIICAILSLNATASTINLQPFDQRKLAILMSKMSSDEKSFESVEVTSPASGKKNTVTFPASGPFRIKCTNVYYLNSPFSTDGTCKVSIDMKGHGVSQKNDEIRFITSDSEVVTSFYKAIPYSKSDKDFRGWERDDGSRDFDGIKTSLFHFVINCTKSRCTFRFSAKNLVP